MVLVSSLVVLALLFTCSMLVLDVIGRSGLGAELLYTASFSCVIWYDRTAASTTDPRD